MKPLIGVLLAAALQAQGSSVQGVAIRMGTTDPIPGARVMLAKVGGRLGDTRVATADERGRFVFGAVGAGIYRLMAQHEAFVRPDGRTMTIGAGQSIRDLIVTMTPTGVITGRVVDAYGDPASDVYVRATLNDSTFEATTNDLGEYRLYGLPPGAYVVSAAPYLAPRIEKEMRLGNAPPMAMIITPTRPSPFSPGEGQGMIPLAGTLKAGSFIPFMALRGESHSTVYFPGTTDRAAAGTVDVPAGAVIGAINFTTAVSAAR